jgi:phosphate transport system ATP-binding protein
LHGLRDRKQVDVLVERYLRMSSLWEEVKDRLHTPASRLSVGQQQRLCLSRGLAVEPEVLLCDEPTASLDPVSAQRIEQRFTELKQEYSIVLVTHILRQARRLADYVVFFYMGDLVEHGPAEQLLNDPRDERTKAYLSGTIS